MRKRPGIWTTCLRWKTKKLIADKHPIPSLEDESTASKQPPGAIKKLRSIYRDSFGKLEQQRAASLKLLTDPLVVRLKALESDLTRKDRIADAKVAKGIGRGWSQRVSIHHRRTRPQGRRYQLLPRVLEALHSTPKPPSPTASA